MSDKYLSTKTMLLVSFKTQFYQPQQFHGDTKLDEIISVTTESVHPLIMNMEARAQKGSVCFIMRSYCITSMLVLPISKLVRTWTMHCDNQPYSYGLKILFFCCCYQWLTRIWPCLYDAVRGFQAPSQNCEKRLIVQLCLSISPYASIRSPSEGFLRKMIFDFLMFC